MDQSDKDLILNTLLPQVREAAREIIALADQDDDVNYLSRMSAAAQEGRSSLWTIHDIARSLREELQGSRPVGLRLKTQKKEVYLVQYYDLEELIVDSYPSVDAVSVAAMEEWRNDSEHLFHVDGEDFDMNRIEEWLRGDVFNYVLEDIMQHLCYREVIQPGNYLVKVCW